MVHDQNDREGVVRVGKLKTLVVKYSVKTGPLSTKQDVLFKPGKIPRWPEWLNFTGMVIGLQKGNWLRIVVPVTNERNHDIVLTPHRVLGQLQQVKVVYPADVRPVSISDNRNSTVSTPEHHKEENRKWDSCTHDSWDPLVSVDHLTPDQQKKK